MCFENGAATTAAVSVFVPGGAFIVRLMRLRDETGHVLVGIVHTLAAGVGCRRSPLEEVAHAHFTATDTGTAYCHGIAGVPPAEWSLPGVRHEFVFAVTTRRPGRRRAA